MLTVAFLAALLPGAPRAEHLTASVRRIVHDDWRQVAAAQAPQGELRPVTEEGLPLGSLGCLLHLAGRDLRFVAFPPDDTRSERETDPERGRERGTARDVAVDLDGSGTFEPEEILPLASTAGNRVSLRPFDLPFELYLHEFRGTTRLVVRTLAHFEADLELGGNPIHVFVVDRDLDGAPSMGDDWLALTPSQVEALPVASMPFAANRAVDPWYFGERTLHLAGPAEGERLRFTFGPAKRPRHEFLAERSARARQPLIDSYEEDAAEFLAGHGIDPGRPVDPQPPSWYHAWDLDEALEIARRTGRPLYVEFGSDGCPWCPRYDWLNYEDAEVTALLRHFTLVKINRDLDPNQTARGLGIEGVPAHVLFDPNGEKLHSSTGWFPPSDYAAILREAWERVASATRSGPEPSTPGR